MDFRGSAAGTCDYTVWKDGSARDRRNVYSSTRESREKPAACWHLSNTCRTTETGIARTVNTESPLTILGSYFCSALPEYRCASMPPIYVDIMDINIFIRHGGRCRALCAPINHVAVILITSRIESAFPTSPREKVQICMQRRCGNIYRGYMYIYSYVRV